MWVGSSTVFISNPSSSLLLFVFSINSARPRPSQIAIFYPTVKIASIRMAPLENNSKMLDHGRGSLRFDHQRCS